MKTCKFHFGIKVVVYQAILIAASAEYYFPNGQCPCDDVSPDAAFSCELQAYWGKCNDDFFVRNNYCACICQRCPFQGLSKSLSELNEASGDEFSELIPEGEYVQRSGTRFVLRSSDDECETFYFVGWNTYYLMVKAAQSDTRYEVIEVLDDAVKMGLTVIRTWAFSNGPMQWHALQRYPGLYDESVLIGMDFVLHEASKRGIRVVLVFANYWQHYGGIDQYNIWSFQAGEGDCNGEYNCRDEFFVDMYATNLYKKHVEMFLNRRNTLNGRLYREDPAIFGYNLMNEPRSKYDLYVVTRESSDLSVGQYNITYNNGSALQSWIEDVAQFVKSIDPVHLLTIGEEGFFGESTPLYLYANPGAWATLEGNDFVRNHKAWGIDYATFHVYVDQWLCDIQGSTKEGQMRFFRDWLEAHQQAAEEELQMPLVLEEFGGKLEDGKRRDLYQFAYTSQIESTARGGSLGGVMFWVLYHQDYLPMNHYGGAYGMYYPPTSMTMAEVTQMTKKHSEKLLSINKDSSSSSTCLWYPQYPRGLGCREIKVSLELGGMPWSCLPGEPENINWCNAQGRWDLYNNPPQEWRGRSNGEELPFNTIEVLVMGRISNTVDHVVNLDGSYMIIPFSRGIHTIFEGVWERVENPNVRFEIYCWYVTIFERDGSHKRGYDLCDNAENKTRGISFSFTEFGWPYGVKRDRGLRIDFHGEILLNPGAYIAANKEGSSVIVSFKDKQLHNRLDISSVSLAGASECPSGPRLLSWPPPPPPPPPPCNQGKHPYRACPQLNWYDGDAESVEFLSVAQMLDPCVFDDCPDDTFNPYSYDQSSMPQLYDAILPPQAEEGQGQDGWNQIVISFADTMAPTTNETFDDFAFSIQNFTALENNGSSLSLIEVLAASVGNKVTPRALMNNPMALAAGFRSLQDYLPGLQFNSNFLDDFQDFNLEVDSENSSMKLTKSTRNLLQLKIENDDVLDVLKYSSMSNEFEGESIGLLSGQLYWVSADITAYGNYREGEKRTKVDDDLFDLSEAILAKLSAKEEPVSVGLEDIGPTAADTPNPEERGSSSRGGLQVQLMAEVELFGMDGKRYLTIARGNIFPNTLEIANVRGLISLPPSTTSVKIYAQVPVSGLILMLSEPRVLLPNDVPIELGESYIPCILDPDRSPDSLLIFEADTDDEWEVEICSRGYAQTLYVYNAKEEIRQFGYSTGTWKLTLKVERGQMYHFALDGSDHGSPYGSWRGGSGLRIKRNSGRPFLNLYDEKQSQSDKFVRAEDGKFWLGCNRFAYVGVNTWDLMDIARYPWRLEEVDQRLDALQNAGLTVGRIWAFSLGKGTEEEERAQRLQLQPGVYDETVFVGLDYVLHAASLRNIKLILSLEDFWLSIGKYGNWSNTMISKTDFYTDWKARTFYKQHLQNLVHRNNTFNGIKYRDDPSILAWNLMNEPRCTGCGWALQAWVDEMSTHMKSLDPNHMVTIGEEGFYSSTCHRVHINPGAGTRRSGIGSSPWALAEGQDFIQNHRSDSIDFATVHIWADNWIGHADYCGYLYQNKQFDYSHGCDLWKEKLDYTKIWLGAHIEDANKIGKPLIVQEFGKTIEASKLFTEMEDVLLPGETVNQGLYVRNQFFEAIYKLIEQDALRDGNTLGSNFWNLYREGHGEVDPYHVTLAQESTMQIVADHVYNMKSLTTSTSNQCNN